MIRCVRVLRNSWLRNDNPKPVVVRLSDGRWCASLSVWPITEETFDTHAEAIAWLDKEARSGL